MKNRDLIRDAMMFAVKDITGRVLREASVQSMIDDLERQLNIPFVNIELPDDAIHFAEWLDIVGIRDGRFEWKYKADNYKQKYTTKEMFVEWKRILGD